MKSRYLLGTVLVVAVIAWLQPVAADELEIIQDYESAVKVQIAELALVLESHNTAGAEQESLGDQLGLLAPWWAIDDDGSCTPRDCEICNRNDLKCDASGSVCLCVPWPQQQ